jgi:hypothetical protein
VRTPIRPFPERIARWTAWARGLRWLDALIASLLVWGLVARTLAHLPPGVQAALAAVPIAILALIPPIRAGWRPVSGLVALRLSRTLVPGERAWHVQPGAAELVIVTARRGLRVTIAAPGRGGAEGVSVRRTRALLVSADDTPPRAAGRR